MPRHTEAFVTKIDTLETGSSSLIESTYYGGSNWDEGLAIDVSGSSEVDVGGFTYSSDLPLHEEFKSSLGGSQDGFFVKINPDFETVEFSTYFGGSEIDIITGVSIFGNAVFGCTGSSDFPLDSPYQSTLKGGDLFIVDNSI